MIAWLRRVDTWLEQRGVRRTVLLVVGSAGLATALVAGFASTQVSRVGHAVGSAPVAVDAGQAAADVARAWERYQDLRDARPAVRARVDAAGDAVSSAVDALARAADRRPGPAADAGSVYTRAKALLLLVFCLGTLAALGLVRLLVAAVRARARRMLTALREGPAPKPAADAAPSDAADPPGDGAPGDGVLAGGPLGEMARSMATATALMQVAVRRMEAREERPPAASVDERDVDAGWWLHPASSGR